jgi:hypothetical protein
MNRLLLAPKRAIRNFTDTFDLGLDDKHITLLAIPVWPADSFQVVGDAFDNRLVKKRLKDLHWSFQILFLDLLPK